LVDVCDTYEAEAGGRCVTTASWAGRTVWPKPDGDSFPCNGKQGNSGSWVQGGYFNRISDPGSQIPDPMGMFLVRFS
jgi:hypothetical protein